MQAKLVFLSRLPGHLSLLYLGWPSSLLSASFSTRPTRSERRRDDDRSEDFFLRNLSFGDGDGDGDAHDDNNRRKGAENPQPRHHRASPGGISHDYVDGPSRGDPLRQRREAPLRERNDIGGGRGEASRDLFPDFGGDHPRKGGSRYSPSSQMSGRRERPEFLSPSQQTMREFGDDYRKKFDSSKQQNSPPLFDNGAKEGGWEPGPGSFAADDAARSRGDPNGDTLLQRLDLGEVGSGENIEKDENKRPLNAMSGDNSASSEALSQDADEIFRKMKETGLIPNAVAMLDGLCKDGLIQEAMKLFGLMREKGTIPEVVIYTAVVEGFCKAAKFDDAKRIFKKMQKNGVVPNAYSYTVLIQGLSKGGRLDDLTEFCLEMLDSGHSPNVATFIGFTDRFCKDKGVEQAEDVIRRLQERGFALDEKAVREYLDKKGPFSPMVWEAIFGKKKPQKPF